MCVDKAAKLLDELVKAFNSNGGFPPLTQVQEAIKTILQYLADEGERNIVKPEIKEFGCGLVLAADTVGQIDRLLGWFSGYQLSKKEKEKLGAMIHANPNGPLGRVLKL